jgi:ferric-dicitrate binding protein FerR (iron transport regulator)
MADYHTFVRRYRAASTPGPDTVDRVRRGLHAPRRRSPIPRLAAGGVILAVAAALLLSLRPPAAPAETPLAHGELALTRDVRLSTDGEGVAHTRDRQIEIAWAHGTLGVEVEPERGVQLAVVTDEATVRVVGTGFTVLRDALGTRVAVSHGKVETDCAFGGPVLLVAGETRTCLPRTAVGAVGRIRALQAARIGPTDALAEIDAALARPDAIGAAANELGALRVGALLDLGRDADALLASEHVLTTAPGARDGDLHRVAARLHVAAGRCDAARPHLAALAAAAALGEDAALVPLCHWETP